MLGRVIVVWAIFLGLACSCARAGQAAITVDISARVDSFAEWCVDETSASVTTDVVGRSLCIAKTLKLYANTDATLTLAPGANEGILTADDGEVLQTATVLTGDLAPVGPGETCYIRHVPGCGVYKVTISVQASLPEGATIRSAEAACNIQPRHSSRQRATVLFQVNTSGPDSQQAKAYRCGVILTAVW